MATADHSVATRELFDRTLQDQVYYRTPIIDDLQSRNQITYSGGKYIEKLIDTAEIDSLVQEYTTNQALTDAKLTTLAKPRFTWKNAQLPLRYDLDEYADNIHAGKEEQLLNLATHLSQKGQRAIKLWLQKMIFNSAGTTGVADSATTFQSLLSALDSDVTYGTLSRSLSGGTRDYWQGADPADLTQNISSTSQNTSYNLSANQLRKWINETDVSHHMESEDDLTIAMCPTLFDKLAAEVESKIIYAPGATQKQGVRSIVWDGHKVVSVPYLQRSSTTKTWLFILNMRYWELRIHTLRNFKMTDFVWQGQNSNGYDYWLARIMVRGNFMCWKPNSSMYLQSVS